MSARRVDAVEEDRGCLPVLGTANGASTPVTIGTNPIVRPSGVHAGEPSTNGSAVSCVRTRRRRRGRRGRRSCRRSRRRRGVDRRATRPGRSRSRLRSSADAIPARSARSDTGRRSATLTKAIRFREDQAGSRPVVSTRSRAPSARTTTRVPARSTTRLRPSVAQSGRLVGCLRAGQRRPMRAVGVGDLEIGCAELRRSTYASLPPVGDQAGACAPRARSRTRPVPLPDEDRLRRPSRPREKAIAAGRVVAACGVHLLREGGESGSRDRERGAPSRPRS